jgi:tyrosine-protein kinase Etk/Wzc
VLLVDGDLRSCSLSVRASPKSTTIGLAEVLRGEVTFDSAIRHSSELGVAFLPAGSARGNAGHLLGLPSLQSTLATLERVYDLVVIDSPPVLAGVDTWLLGHRAGTTLMLTRWRHTPVKQAALAIKMLTVSGARLAGVALSMVNVTQNARYDHGDAALFSSAMRRYHTETLALRHDSRGGAA